LLPASSASFICWRISMRLKRWKASPSTTAASIFSRRNIHSKVVLTVLVPAPEEPVTEMMGCLADMRVSPGSGQLLVKSDRSPNSGEVYGLSSPRSYSS